MPTSVGMTTGAVRRVGINGRWYNTFTQFLIIRHGNAPWPLVALRLPP
jgi:hypothetical protein